MTSEPAQVIVEIASALAEHEPPLISMDWPGDERIAFYEALAYRVMARLERGKRLRSPTVVAMLALAGEHDTKVMDDSRSPWIIVDVLVRGYELHSFGVWRETDELFEIEPASASDTELELFRMIHAPREIGETALDLTTYAELVA